MRDTIDIIKLAREAGLTIEDVSSWGAIITAEPEELKRFADLVRADEREVCAKVCEEIFTISDAECYGREFAEAIRTRLEQPEEKYTYGTPLLNAFTKPAPVQEPVAWMYEVNGAHTILDLFEPPDDAYDEGTLHPLYTTPPAAQRQWVGLTNEEIAELDCYDHLKLARAIEAKLKEKNNG